MRLQHPLAAVAPTIGAGVLLVLARADTDFTAPRIHKLLPEKGSLPGVRKALTRLVSQGLVLESITGNTHSYRLNRRHILAEPIIAITRSKERLLERIRDDIASWPTPPTTVKIFGSAARGEMRDDSDVDVLIVLPDDVDHKSAETAIARLSDNVSIWTGNDVRPLVYREEEIAASPIFQSILDEGIDVAGDIHWLRRRIRHVEAAP